MLTRRFTVPLLLFFLLAAIFIFHACYYYPFFSDDSFISLRYAKRLVQGLGLTWTHGPPVEGYSNLLWVLLNALLGKVISDYMLSARILGVLGAVVALFFISRAPEPRVRLDPFRMLTAGLFFVCSAPVAVWAIGGLEQGFMTGGIAGALYFISRALDQPALDRRSVLLSSAYLAVLTLTRVDGVVFTGAFALGVIISLGLNRRGVKTVLLLCSVPVLVYCAQLVFRVFYYGEWVSNTTLAKVAFNTVRLKTGLAYTASGVATFAVIAVAGIAMAVASRRKLPRHRWVLPSLSAVLWILCVIAVGGDIFGAFRQLVPVFVFLVMMVADAVAAEREWLSERKPLLAVFLILLVGAHATIQLKNERCAYIKERNHWELAGFSTGMLLKKAFGKKDPLLAVDAAGSLPFWSELRSLDMLGLNDRYIATHPPKKFGYGGIAHELGDGNYVLSQKPDLVVFNSALGSVHPHWRSGRQMKRQRRFQNNYQLSFAKGIMGPEAFIRMFIRMDGPLGVVRRPTSVTIPGYLFAKTRKTAARLGSKDRLYVNITPRRSGRLTDLRMPRGTWRLSAHNALPVGNPWFTCRNGIVNTVPKGPGAQPAPQDDIIQLKNPTFLDIVLKTIPKGTVRVYDVVLSKVDDGLATVVCTPKTDPVQRSLQQLDTRVKNGTKWGDPRVVRFTDAGVVVKLAGRRYFSSLTIGLDADDEYCIEYRADGATIATSKVAPQKGKTGMFERRIEIPHEVIHLDALHIKPVRGDKRYSLGHVLPQ